MKDLTQIKDEVARSYDFKDYIAMIADLCNSPNEIDVIIDEIAIACQEQLRRDCAERAKTIKSGNSGSWYDASIDKNSILETPLIR